MYILIDCNNFFVSCEKLFRPDLKNKPVAVLSNNDGCIVSRSQEVKDLNIPMGAPAFKYKKLIKDNNITLFSGNFSLYGDISNRVMNTLYTLWSDIEIYSIDEAFLEVPNWSNESLLEFGNYIKETVFQWTGIPVSVGIAPTKTLAKLANYIAKKNPEYENVCHYNLVKNKQQYLKNLETQTIWGIGKQSAKKLKYYGVYSIADLLKKNSRFVKNTLGSPGLITLRELRGFPCIKNSQIPITRKGIMSSRSFGKPITSKEKLQESLSHFTAIASRKLRKQKSLATQMNIYIRGEKDGKKVFYSFGTKLPSPTSFTPSLVKQAHNLLNKIYEENVEYKKASVMIWGLIPDEQIQLDLFKKDQIKNKKQEDALMNVIDVINQAYGNKSIFFAGQGIKPEWKAKKEKSSPEYTTKWKELKTIKL